MNSPVSGSESSAFSLLDERIQRWIWQAGWTDLKDAQEQAIPLLLAGERDLIIAAATASGKTEAAFFPILTRILDVKEPSSVLYISPLKALINDQWGRLAGLCETLAIPVVPWHGDISASRKRAFRKDPRGCLLITPESLEGLLMREGHALTGVLGNLRYIVIDELHAFLDTERGKQLQSLMHRIDVALVRRVPRVGLSATLGDMRLAAGFLRSDAVDQVDIVESGAGNQELKVIVKGFQDVPARLPAAEPQSLDRAAEELAEEEVASPATLAIGTHLFATLRGSNNLVFPNSRSRVELYADQLRRACERMGVPNEFWPHHGSLSKEVREETERALKAGDRPATAIATTTLELGIDIGAVKSIAQIGPAPSVASLRQRLGRSGRRRGEPAILRCYCLEKAAGPDLSISDQLRESLLQTIAQIQLLTEHWFEPPRTQSLHLSTLVQQLLSLIAQYGGLSPATAWALLVASAVFPGCSQAEFVGLLRSLGEKDILMQDSSGLLLHGPLGEQIVNHYSFLAAFVSNEEFRVVCRGRQLGTLPLDRPIAADSFLIFAGHRWRVVGCYPEEKLIDVVPGGGGRVPGFDGMGGKVHDRVRLVMRDLLRTSAVLRFLDDTAQAQLGEARRAYRRLNLDEKAVIATGADVEVFTWLGDWVNDTLVLMLDAKNLVSTNDGLCLTVHRAEKTSVVQALREIASAPPPAAEALAARVENKVREKWDSLLPDDLLCRNYASSELDIAGAVAAAAAISST